MGTLFDQKPRVESLASYHHPITEALKLMGVKGTPKPDEWRAACDIVRTALAVQSADVLDEQLAGLGGILQDISEALKR